MEEPRFADPEVATFWRYIASSIDRLVALVEAIAADGLAWCPPAPGANSIHALAIHTMGNPRRISCKPSAACRSGASATPSSRRTEARRACGRAGGSCDHASSPRSPTLPPASWPAIDPTRGVGRSTGGRS